MLASAEPSAKPGRNPAKPQGFLAKKDDTMLEMQIKINDEGQGVKTLALPGNLDATAVQQLESEGISLIAKGCKALVIDCSGLEFINSAGLRAIFIIAQKIMQLGGKLAICGATDTVKKALTMSGFDSFIPLKDNRTEAIAACSSPENKNAKQ